MRSSAKRRCVRGRPGSPSCGRPPSPRSAGLRLPSSRATYPKSGQTRPCACLQVLALFPLLVPSCLREYLGLVSAPRRHLDFTARERGAGKILSPSAFVKGKFALGGEIRGARKRTVKDSFTVRFCKEKLRCVCETPRSGVYVI